MTAHRNPDIGLFDAWNRLVAVSVGGKERAAYTYYPMHQRATRKADTTFTESPIVFDEHDLFYYDAAWRLFEERRFGAAAFTGDAETIVQRLWGLTYIDEYLGQMVDKTWDNGGTPTPPDGDMMTNLVSRHYAVCDRRHDVVAMLGFGGDLIERIRYAAYGVAQVRKAADMTGTPGAVDGADNGSVLGGWGDVYGDANYDVALDLNLDGTVDGGDFGLLLGAWGAYDAAEGKVSTVGNTIAYAGYVYDEAVDSYLARNRWYDAASAIWLTRDPIGYSGGVSLYTYVHRRPGSYVDPFGLQHRLLKPGEKPHDPIDDGRHRDDDPKWTPRELEKMERDLEDKGYYERENLAERGVRAYWVAILVGLSFVSPFDEIAFFRQFLKLRKLRVRGRKFYDDAGREVDPRLCETGTTATSMMNSGDRQRIHLIGIDSSDR